MSKKKKQTSRKQVSRSKKSNKNKFSWSNVITLISILLTIFQIIQGFYLQFKF